MNLKTFWNKINLKNKNTIKKMIKETRSSMIWFKNTWTIYDCYIQKNSYVLNNQTPLKKYKNKDHNDIERRTPDSIKLKILQFKKWIIQKGNVTALKLTDLWWITMFFHFMCNHQTPIVCFMYKLNVFWKNLNTPTLGLREMFH